MARTSKTVIGGGEGEQSDRMMRAESSGQDARQRAHEGLMNQSARGQAQAQQMAESAASQVGQGEQMKQQQGQFDARMAEDKHQFDVQTAQRDEQTDLEAAKSGLERTGSSPKNDRATKLAQEMERGSSQTSSIGPLDQGAQERLKGQGEKPMELQGRWQPNEERKQQARRQNFEADTARMRAETERDELGQRYQAARLKQNREEMAATAATLSKPINADVEKFDRLMNSGKEPRASDWTDLAEYAKGSEEVDPSLMADIKKQDFSPRVQQFLRSHISKEAIKYIIRTGETSNLKIDWASPKMRAFTEEFAYANSQAKQMGPEFSQFAGIKSVDDKMSYLNQYAAIRVYLGMDTAPSPMEGMLPSAGGGGGGAQQSLGETFGGGGQQEDPARGTDQPHATPQMTERAIQARRAGQKNIAPADTSEFRRQFGDGGR